VAPSGTTTDADETPAGVYDALAPVYDAMGGARFATLVADRLDPLLSSDRGAFLDLGCGTGALLCALRERHPGWRLSGGRPPQAGRRGRALGAGAAAGSAPVHGALRRRRRLL
jgi:hypothetical protein